MRNGVALKESFKGKRITVVGMGASGIAAASLLVREGADVLVVDDRQKAVPSSLSSLSQEAGRPALSTSASAADARKISSPPSWLF
ncbi:MAG: NAD(P)-binding protein [Candidatus Manganitrophus sp.]|nr:MAG: NAD(P)-binding protein [Candidatus Manganitrophus sp.]